MKFLFCGLGSIGERHLSNLLALGEKDVIAYRKTNLPRSTIKEKIKLFNTLEEALLEKPDAAFITNPSAFHIEYAVKLAKANCHLFIEKPLDVSKNNLDLLESIVHKNKLILMVGFMMRYHPAIVQIKKWLDNNVIGFPIFAKSMWGEYLPSWHPWEDYRVGYSARKELGGGPVNTLCHDIDLSSWFFGNPYSIFAVASRKSSIKISTEHSVEIILRHRDNFTSQIHLDFIQLPPKRTWEIVGDKGRIEFDYYTKIIKLFTFDKTTLRINKTEINYEKRFDKNDMYLDEVKNFILSIKGMKKNDIPFQDGINNLKIIIAAHKSMRETRIVKFSEV